MSQVTGCVHEFSYLLKKYSDNDYTGRVLQIPAVIVNGRDRDEVESKVKVATLDYLQTFEEDHEKAKQGLLEPVLVTTANGTIIETKIFKVKC